MSGLILFSILILVIRLIQVYSNARHIAFNIIPWEDEQYHVRGGFGNKDKKSPAEKKSEGEDVMKLLHSPTRECHATLNKGKLNPLTFEIDEEDMF